MENDFKAWLKRAESALSLGKANNTDYILYEDLCFQLQQAAEKAIKALLIYNNIEPPKTHSFKILINKLETLMTFPEQIKRLIELEDYAVQTRYPGDYTPVDEDEYLDALKITEDALKWIKTKLKG